MPNLLEKCALIARAVGLNQTQLGVLLEEQGVAGVLAASNAMMGIVPPANATLPSMAAALAGFFQYTNDEMSFVVLVR